MKKGVEKTTEKYVTEKTFEKHMRSIAKSFEANGRISELILKEVTDLHNDHKQMRATINGIVSDVIINDRKIKGLTTRVEKLEVK